MNNYGCDNIGENFIFIHIPKNAGTSVYRALGMEVSRHYTAEEYKKMIGDKQYKEMFSFGFVRNPWERFLSLYHYARMDESYYHSAINPEKAKYGKHMDYDLLKKASLRDCARFLLEGKLKHNPPHVQWQPQVTWTHDANGENLVKFIGRVENLQEDFNRITQQIGRPAPVLAKTNASTSKTSYRDAFDEETRQIVTEFYRHDVEIFQYQF
ncbi:MAG: sulfotransferase family 2 domain-containing protein [Flavobacteriales bacterium]|nr:sulfotransferase family 2 domain-containing protein [Flavobacteriales bacterium]